MAERIFSVDTYLLATAIMHRLWITCTQNNVYKGALIFLSDFLFSYYTLENTPHVPKNSVITRRNVKNALPAVGTLFRLSGGGARQYIRERKGFENVQSVFKEKLRASRTIWGHSRASAPSVVLGGACGRCDACQGSAGAAEARRRYPGGGDAFGRRQFPCALS
jgi:hypothetical protein